MFAAIKSGLGYERDRSLAVMVWLVLALGVVAGNYIQEPPIQPPGILPWTSGQPKECPVCHHGVIPKRRGRYICKYCGHSFKASEATDYRRR